MTVASAFNASVVAGRDAARALEEALAAAYLAAYRAAGRDAVAAFLARAPLPAVAAADDRRPWSKPEPSELSNDEKVAAAMEAKTKAARKKMLAAVAAELVSYGFDVTSPFAQQLIDRLALQENRAVEIRERVAAAVDKGYAEGLSVPDTADLIMEAVEAIAPARAQTLARTDLNGVSNGASVMAAQAAGLPYKRWLTAHDDRVRDMHVEADGQTVPIDEPFQVCDATMRYPGDPDGPDACVYNCRCTVLFVESRDELVVSNVPVVGAAGPDVEGLAMVAVYPTADEQQAIARAGGQDAETLHTTMVFLGEVNGLDLEACARAVQRAAELTPPLDGRVGGVGVLAEGPDGMPQFAIPNVQGLAELRHTLCVALADEGVVSPSEHDWVPHMTLAYTDTPELPDLDVVGLPLTFASVALVVADERTDYDFTGGPPMRPKTAAAVTIQVDNDTADEPAEAPAAWISDLAFEGAATTDGRYILPGAIEWRDLPLTLMSLLATGPGGHQEAEVGGRIDTIFKDTGFDMYGDPLPEGVVAARARGVFDAGEHGAETARMVGDDTVRGVSVDLAPAQQGEWCFRDPETGELFDPDDMTEAEWERAFFGELQYAWKRAKIMGATVCPMPAFDYARIARTASGELAGATLWAPIRIAPPDAEPVTASAAGRVPSKPPVEWFEIPEPDFACPLTVDDDGRVYGHLADWSSCHVGLPGCETPPTSRSGYAYFHVGELETQEGVRVAVGKIMLGGPHAQVRDNNGRVVGAAEASKHYDDHTYVGAYVRAHDGRYGIWVSGTLRPDLPEHLIQELMVNPPSGDWRPINGSLELIAGLAVPVPGHPLPRQQYAITAAADGSQQVDALIAFGLDPAEVDEAAADRAIRVLAARASGGIEALAELALAD